jgi:hypothetical protein
VKKLFLVSVGLLLVAGCTTKRVSTSNAAAAVGPQLSVERFLQAANTRDLVGMSRIFGTESGPIGDTGNAFGCFWKKLGSIFGGDSCRSWSDVELTLDAIAEILTQDDYQIVSEQRVPGRTSEATRIGVDMTLPGAQKADDIGFVVVMSKDRWFIQCIELDKVMSGTHNGECRRQ